MKRVSLLVVGGIFLVTLLACSERNQKETNGPSLNLSDKAIGLTPFTSCEELVDKVKTSLKDSMERFYKVQEKACQPDEPVSFPQSAGLNNVNFTGTNLQEEEVDEADLVKTDGQYLYSLDKKGKKLRVIKIWPSSEFGEVAQMNITGEPLSLYFMGNKVTVFSEIKPEVSNTDVAKMSAVPGTNLSSFGEGTHCNFSQAIQTKALILDVSNPSQLQVEKESIYEGCLESSRRIQEKIYLVLQSYLNTPRLNYQIDMRNLPKCSEKLKQPTQATLDTIQKLREENEQKIDQMNFDSLLPQAKQTTKDQCKNIHYAEAVPTANRLSSLVSIDTANSTTTDQITSVLSGSGYVYASKNAIYVASPNATNFIDQSMTKPEEAKTVIHQFKLDSSSQGPNYTGSSAVSGYLVNQFAMSEYQGILRVATTVGHASRDGNSQSDSRIFTMDAEQPNLPLIGSVEGLGRGEQIRAVRFLGSRGFVVTFKKIDPLFIIDLSDPKKPEVKGELKIPGFSTYLHVLDEDHLVGLGHGADDQGNFAWFQGVQLSLFDVSDSTHPSALQQIEIGSRGTESDAVFNHHAFTYDSTQRLLVLPMRVAKSQNSGGSQFGSFEYAGFHLFNVDITHGFQLRGILRQETADTTLNGFWGGDRGYRSIVVRDNNANILVTVSPDGVYLYKLDANLTLLGKTP